jgi:hypothetical protein
VTRVDKDLDQIPASFRFEDLNGVAKGAYKYYDAVKMHGLPVGVQVVAQRLQEEKVLTAMTILKEALEKSGIAYHVMDVE